jgi:hypothetical protein
MMENKVKARLRWDRGHYPKPPWVGYAIILNDPAGQYGTDTQNSTIPLDKSVSPDDWNNDLVTGEIKGRGCNNFRFVPTEKIEE